MHSPLSDPQTSGTKEKSTRAAGVLAARMARAYAKALSDAMEPIGLAPAQFAVVRELAKTDGLTQGDLARRLGVEQATMANTLKRMERDGLVTRRPHPTDRRAQVVALTTAALALKAPAAEAAKAVATRALGGLSRKEQKKFVGLSRRIVEALERFPP